MKCLALFIFLSLMATSANEELSLAEFERLHAELNPQGELWKTIPWQTSLIEAQNLAAIRGKPLFIWAMDGHPLGCT